MDVSYTSLHVDYDANSYMNGLHYIRNYSCFIIKT